MKQSNCGIIWIHLQAFVAFDYLQAFVRELVVETNKSLTNAVTTAENRPACQLVRDKCQNQASKHTNMRMESMLPFHSAIIAMSDARASSLYNDQMSWEVLSSAWLELSAVSVSVYDPSIK